MNTLLKITLFKSLPAFVLWGLMAGKGCAPSEGDSESGKQKAGCLSGREVDPQGKPLSGGSIFADNTMFYNDTLQASSDASGNYRIPTPTGSWKATAQIQRTFK